MTTLKSDLLFMESLYLSLEPTMLDEGLGDFAKGALHKVGKFGAGLAAAGAMMAGSAAPAHAIGALPQLPPEPQASAVTAPAPAPAPTTGLTRSLKVNNQTPQRPVVRAPTFKAPVAQAAAPKADPSTSIHGEGYAAWKARQDARTPEEKESAKQWDAFSDRQQAKFDQNNKRWDDMNDRTQRRQEIHNDKFEKETYHKLRLDTPTFGTLKTPEAKLQQLIKNGMNPDIAKRILSTERGRYALDNYNIKHITAKHQPEFNGAGEMTGIHMGESRLLSRYRG